MRFRAVVAFLVGAVLFAVVPRFDRAIPGKGESGELLIGVVLGLAVGAAVVLVAGHWRAWSLALAATLAGALAAQIYYEVALEPPPTDGLNLGSVVFGAFYAFVFSGPFVVVGALVVGAALALASTLRRA